MNVNVEQLRHILGFEVGRRSYVQAGMGGRITHEAEIYFECRNACASWS